MSMFTVFEVEATAVVALLVQPGATQAEMLQFFSWITFVIQN